MSDATSVFPGLRFENVFATPLITHHWQEAGELNPLLRESILAHETKSDGIAKSNFGGWHSETGQLEFCADAGRRLVRYLFALAREATRRILDESQREMHEIRWQLEAWANVNRSGGFNKMHIHPGSTWSGTYYVDAGNPADPQSGTALHLWDPCPARSATFLGVPESIYLRPRPGLMVLFPSYVPHMVLPHIGDGTRISIAFNLRKEPFP